MVSQQLGPHGGVLCETGKDGTSRETLKPDRGSWNRFTNQC